MATTAVPEFHAPGPGVWEMDSMHFAKPQFGVVAEVFPVAFSAGMRSCMQSYGMLLEGFDVRIVHGFPYMQARPVGAPEGGGKAPPPWLFKLIFKALVTFHPEIRRRLQGQRDLFERRPWLAAVRAWDERMRAETIAKHAAVDAVDVAALDDRALAAHLLRTRDHAIEILTQDHRLNLDSMLPVGDYLARGEAWTGLAKTVLLAALRGSSQISTGDSLERRALLAAMEGDAEARSLLFGSRPARDIWDGLLAREGAVGQAMRDYRVIWGNAICDGIDTAASSVEDAPGPTILALRACLTPGSAPARGLDAAEAEARVLAAVPAAHRAEMEVILSDAKLTYRLRDERHLYGALPVLGLGRRAIKEVGRRLFERGVLTRSELAFVGGSEELGRLLLGEAPELVAELLERSRLSELLRGDRVPTTLGGTPEPPPPAEWMPHEAARRCARALDAYMAAIAEAPRAALPSELSGLAVSSGVYEGRARVCTAPGDLDRIEPGDVLVAPLTTPAINVVLPILGAVVTDRGGALSHAAIVTREYGIPGVVGTRTATLAIRDGQRIRVDGDAGTVTTL